MMNVASLAPDRPVRNGPSLPAREADRGRDPRAGLSTLAWPMFGLLGLEFLLGMALNLLVPVSTGGGVSVVTSSPVLVLHILLAVFLVGITARAVVTSRRVGERRLLGAAGLGLLSAVGAFLAGMAFTFDGQSVGASYAMAVGFLGVMVAAALLLGWGRSRPKGVDLSPGPQAPSAGEAAP